VELFHHGFEALGADAADTTAASRVDGRCGSWKPCASSLATDHVVAALADPRRLRARQPRPNGRTPDSLLGHAGRDR
jgi:hypothetical protein